jgi:pyruvate kinase
MGPATSSPEKIRELVDAGMDVARLNMSHGTRDEHAEVYRLIRAASDTTGHGVGIFADLQGPKIRLGNFQEGKETIEPGDRFTITTRDILGDADICGTTYDGLPGDVIPGHDILIDDGKVRLRVDSVEGKDVHTTVIVGGTVSNHKGINLPGVPVSVPAMSEKDIEDLRWALHLSVDYVALSFVRSAKDADDVRQIMREEGIFVPVIAKIEKPQAIDNLDEVVKAFDGFMVARGDLGVECPLEDVPFLQKRVVEKARRNAKPVIVATQMLESMIEAPTPTRAEASDVATAVYDGADAVMLSAESAAGNYPLEAVQMMDNIVAEVEADPFYHASIDAAHPPPEATVADVICQGLRTAAATLPVKAIVTYTTSGSTSLRAARERPAAPILSLTPDAGTARRLALVWGTYAVRSPAAERVAEIVDYACRAASANGLAEPGDVIAIAAGMPFGVAGTTNLLRIERLPGGPA